VATTPLPIPELKLETVRIPEEILVRCTGRITSITADTLKTTIRRLIPESKRVVLDLTDVNYMDSSGLGALVEVFRLAKRQQGEMRIINLNQRLAELFRSTMLASIFEGLEFTE
jgi:anti-sigma B factor antagonist